MILDFEKHVFPQVEQVHEPVQVKKESKRVTFVEPEAHEQELHSLHVLELQYDDLHEFEEHDGMFETFHVHEVGEMSSLRAESMNEHLGITVEQCRHLFSSSSPSNLVEPTIAFQPSVASHGELQRG